jgi:hypothetical protein
MLRIEVLENHKCLWKVPIIKLKMLTKFKNYKN